VSAVLEAVAKRKGTSLLNAALAYCMAKAPYVFPIVGGRKVEHLKANIEALTLRLTEEDIDEIEKGYDFDPGEYSISGCIISPFGSAASG
jgi:aryl-alcohol dehydrogenase-like predicted oxidoreductase